MTAALHTFAASGPVPWHQLPEARAILFGMVGNLPTSIRHERGYVTTSDEWLAYNHEDPRYVRLNEIKAEYLAPYLASAAACRDGRTAAAMDCTTDEAIDAVADRPMLFNVNDADERRTWLHLKEQILGGDMLAARRGGLAVVR
ncbi:MAG: hypothetical protein V4523_08010 [Pseudomonadota bacterium]